MHHNCGFLSISSHCIFSDCMKSVRMWLWLLSLVRVTHGRWDGNSTPLVSLTQCLCLAYSITGNLRKPLTDCWRDDGQDELGPLFFFVFTKCTFNFKWERPLQWGRRWAKKWCLLHLAGRTRWFSLPSTSSVANCSRHAAMQSDPNFKLGLVRHPTWFQWACNTRLLRQCSPGYQVMKWLMRQPGCLFVWDHFTAPTALGLILNCPTGHPNSGSPLYHIISFNCWGTYFGNMLFTMLFFQESRIGWIITFLIF